MFAVSRMTSSRNLFPRGAHLAVTICIKVGISAMKNGWVISDDLFFNACCLKDDHPLLCHGGLCSLHHNIHSVQQFLIMKLLLINLMLSWLNIMALLTTRYCVDCQTFLGCLLTCPGGSSGGSERCSDSFFFGSLEFLHDVWPECGSTLSSLDWSCICNLNIARITNAVQVTIWL